MDYVRGHEVTMYAKRGWMLQDDVVVMMVANLTSNAPYNIVNTLNQCNLNGSVHYATKSDDNAQELSGSSNTTVSSAAWAWHAGIGYVFLASDIEVVLSNKEQQGSLSRIIDGAPTTPISKPVFAGMINHGVLKGMTPVNSAHVIVPAVGVEEMPSIASALRKSLIVVDNSKEVQVGGGEGAGENCSLSILIADGFLTTPGDVQRRPPAGDCLAWRCRSDCCR